MNYKNNYFINLTDFPVLFGSNHPILFLIIALIKMYINEIIKSDKITEFINLLIDFPLIYSSNKIFQFFK